MSTRVCLVIPPLYTPSPPLHQHCGRLEIPTLTPTPLLILVINHSTSWSKLKGKQKEKPIFSLLELWGVGSMCLADLPTRKRWRSKLRAKQGHEPPQAIVGPASDEPGLPRGLSGHRQSQPQRSEGTHNIRWVCLQINERKKGETRWPRGKSKHTQLIVPIEHGSTAIRQKQTQTRQQSGSVLLGEAILVNTSFDS